MARARREDTLLPVRESLVARVEKKTILLWLDEVR